MGVSYRSPRGGLPTVVGFIRREGSWCGAGRLVARLAVFRPSGWMAPVIRNGLTQVVAAFHCSRLRPVSARFGTLENIQFIVN